jgi:hypothetical protein
MESHSLKIQQAKVKLNKAQLILDEHDILTCIKRESFKRYYVIKNFEIVKTYKQRRSCRRYIERLSLSLSLITKPLIIIMYKQSKIIKLWQKKSGKTTMVRKYRQCMSQNWTRIATG